MKIKKVKDEIYIKKKAESLTAVSFLKALKENLDFDLAFKIASDAFTNYMTELYENVLSETKKGTQERFNVFRKFYENYATKTPYLKIIESSESNLKVRYERCPLFEILNDLELGDLAYSFCLSDPAFTKKVLPGVDFSRKNEISKGAPYCDNTWKFLL